MKNLLFVILGICMLSSCSKDDTDERSGAITVWSATSFQANVNPIPIVLGISIAPDFVSTAEDINYQLELNSETGEYKVKGGYTLKSVFSFENVPDIVKEYENVVKTGSFTNEGGNLLFDKSLLDVHTNDIKWTDFEGMDLKFTLSEDGNELTQEQIFENIKVQDGMNGNVRITSVWKKN